MSIYCTYLTVYLGSKLPMFYIGSSSVDKVINGYHGSVKSKAFRIIWESELKTNPNLFKTKIITVHETQIEAISQELAFHIHLKIPKNQMHINKAKASPNGFFGMDVSGKNSPSYNRPYNENTVAKWRASYGTRSAPNKGISPTPEALANIIASRPRGENHQYFGKPSPKSGKPDSDETKAKKKASALARRAKERELLTQHSNSKICD